MSSFLSIAPFPGSGPANGLKAGFARSITRPMSNLTREIAHDLNNQLAVILNYTSFLLEDADDPARLHEDVTEIRRAAERARDRTQQLLAIGREQTVES